MSKTRKYSPEGPEYEGQNHRLRSRDTRKIRTLKRVYLKPFVPDGYYPKRIDSVAQESVYDTRPNLVQQLGEQMLQEGLLT